VLDIATGPSALTAGAAVLTSRHGLGLSGAAPVDPWWGGAMTTFDGLVRRAVDDPTFAERVRTDPVAALAGHELSHEQLRILDRLVRGYAPTDEDRDAPAADGAARG
jgi:hypothetical protein